jgi:four helix bundle protein
MEPRRRVAVQEAADLVLDEVNRMLDSKPRKRLLHVTQLRDSANSVSANIAEGLGRGEGAARNDKYRTARGEAKETISHLRSNFAAERIPSSAYWRLRNRCMTIIKMLDSLLSG